MGRVRHAALAALAVGTTLVSTGGGAVGVPDGSVVPAALVTWPTSSLVLSEVMTGGASASDEFVEVANQGPAVVDLAGLEIVYVTASGSTVSRKAAWAESRPLAPGQRLLLSNAAGIFASVADATYTGGFAATGGAISLRADGGAPVDAVGWGDATSSFVEGSPAAAPPAGSSLERRPGGAAGNGLDTNDNAADWLVAAPTPQSLAAPPVPSPSPSSFPSSQPAPTLPSPTPTPTTAPGPTPTPVPPGTPAPTPTLTPTTEPSAAASSTPAPTPGPTAIAVARGLPGGADVTIAGTLTTGLGAVEDGRGSFLQDGTAGIALYLDQVAATTLAAGTTVVASGTVDSRYGQRMLRLAEADLVVTGTTAMPVALARATGQIGEDVEGTRVMLSGATVGSASTLSDGVGLWVDDGTGPSRVIVADAVIGATRVPAGTVVEVAGPVGQRDSSGTGTGGHRVHVTEAADFRILPTPTPSPHPTVVPTPGPTATPATTATPGSSATPAPTRTPSLPPTPTPSGTPAGAGISIAAARASAVGSRVEVEGVVTAEVGRAGGAGLVAIQDATGGIFVKLPDGAPRPARGTRLRLIAKLHDPYGQLELRPVRDGFRIVGSAGVPGGARIAGRQLGEAVEGRLVVLEGAADGGFRRVSGGDVSATVVASDGTTVRVFADATSGIAQGAVTDEARYRLTGVVGQRAPRKGALEGYRLWLRDRADITMLAGSPPGPMPTPAPGGGQSWTPPAATRPSDDGPGEGGPGVVSVAQALRAGSGTVRIRAVVTAGSNLLDKSGRRIVVQDETAAVEVLLPAGAAGPVVGASIEVAGTIGRAYGAPRVKARTIDVLRQGVAPSPVILAGPPGDAHEWRLVRVSGSVVDVRKLGSRWRAELETPRGRVPIMGLEGAAIPSSVLAEGRPASVIGIVRRAHPSASDRRYAVVPRSRADVSVGPSTSSVAAGPGGASGTGGGAPGGSGGGDGSGTVGGRAGLGMQPDDGVPPESSVVDVDLTDLAAYAGRTVRVGGFVVELTPDGFELDDGTAVGLVVLAGPAAELLALIEVDDPLNVVGVVELREDAAIVRVEDPAGIVRVGDLTAPLAPEADATASVPSGVPQGFDPSTAGAADPLGGSEPGVLGLGTLVLISVASAALTLARRRRLRRALLVRVAARLSALAAGADPPAGVPAGVTAPAAERRDRPGTEGP